MSLTDALKDMNMTPEELEQSDKGAGWNLLVPEAAERGRKKGVARWIEYAEVLDAYHRDEVSDRGAQRLVCELVYKIIPGGDGENAGRQGTLYMRLNPGLAKGKNTLGQHDPKKESLMHSMSMKKIKQLLVASGLSVEAGLTEEVFTALFPRAEDSAGGILIGRKLAFFMKDDKNRPSPNGENNQEPENITAAPEEV